MNTVSSYLRVFGFLTLAYIILELTIDSGTQWAIEKYPALWIVLSLVLLVLVAVEICLAALQKILFQTLKADAKERYLEAKRLRKENKYAWLKETYANLTKSKPIEKESEIILDHNYDGIKELDNSLPPWWVYSFYATILFAFIYMVRFHVVNDYTQDEEYLAEVAAAQKAIEEYKRTAKDLVDFNTVELLTDASDLKAGEGIFGANCVACHMKDGGGGIGPNLTDKYWILGGGIKNVFKTISEGGRDGKGMIAWKQNLKPAQIAQVASYVLSLQGSTPANPKKAEGDLWTDPNAPQEEAPKTSIDSTAIQTPAVDSTSVVSTLKK